MGYEVLDVTLVLCFYISGILKITSLLKTTSHFSDSGFPLTSVLLGSFV